MHRRPARVVMSFLVALVLIGAGFGPVGVSVHAQEVPASGVSGNRYTSPVFPFSVRWGGNWTVADEASSADYTLVQLTNGVSLLWFEVTAFHLDLTACVQSSWDQLASNASVTNLALAENENGPMSGAAEGQSWAIFNFAYAVEYGSVDYSQYVDCRPIVAGESMLTITQLAPSDVWASEMTPLFDVLDQIVIGEAAVAGTDSNLIDAGANGDIQEIIGRSVEDIEA